jgi:hypothetical protein
MWDSAYSVPSPRTAIPSFYLCFPLIATEKACPGQTLMPPAWPCSPYNTVGQNDP